MTETLILTRQEIARLLTLEEYIQPVENAFAFLANKNTLGPGALPLSGISGTFHVKAAGLPWKDKIYAAFKINGNFPGNQTRFGLPTIQGVIALFDAANGTLLALMDSTEITACRTAAATAVAAKYLARNDSSTVTICGCGKQGAAQLKALTYVLSIREAYVCDLQFETAVSFANEMSSTCGFPVHPFSLDGTPGDAALRQATMRSDVIVTCTTAHRYFLKQSDVRAGTFVAAVGADNPDKQELDPKLLSSNIVVTDVLDQCAEIGDLHHAIHQGYMTKAHVRGDLGDIITGKKQGRTSPEEIIIFDSTGTAVQDVAAAVCVYEKALRENAGSMCNLIH